jgi:hypothetical protein
MNFTAPSDPSISIELYASQRHSGLADFFSSTGTDNLAKYALVLANLSSMDIVGLATRWIVTDRDGRQRVTKLSSDSFGDSVAARQAVIPAGTRLISTASGFKHVKVQAATSFVLGGNSRMFGWGRGNFAHMADLDEAQSVTAIVDSIIFADGRVIGPDESNLVGHVNAVSAAFKTFAQRLRGAISAGNLESVLRDFASTRSRLLRFDDDPAAFWTAMEAERMLRFPTPSIAGRLQQLEGFPSPPDFYR